MKAFAAVTLAWVVVTSPACAVAASDAPFADRLRDLVNRYREAHGGRPLALAEPLSALAREHAAQMARDGRLSHDGFQERFAKARAPHCVENVAASGSPQATFDAWRDSPTHAHNLLDAQVSRMGIGVDGRYVAFFACG
jgi:uncharacterized protein YkwD